MKLDLTAREAEMLLIVTTRLLEFEPVDPEIQSVTRKLEQIILEQNQATAVIANQYRQAPLFPRAKVLPEA
jgi:uncharacterized membrane-anchored protein